jgi:hypothetical protein
MVNLQWAKFLTNLASAFLMLHGLVIPLPIDIVVFGNDLNQIAASFASGLITVANIA